MQVESVAEQLFFSTVRIETIASGGATGAGTGFFYRHWAGKENYPFVVTNKHVVMGMREGSLTLHQRQGNSPLLGTGIRLSISDWNQAWYGHPSPEVDIAICPFAPLELGIREQKGVELFYKSIGSANLPSAEQAEKFDAIESITFIGYPNGLWDRKNLLPIARRGTTASPISVDFEGNPTFLVDASVFGGSSGSPVFLLNQGIYTERTGGTVLGSRLLFVGVIASVFYRTLMNEIVAVPIPTQIQPMARQQEMIDLGMVFKARTVVETIEAFLAKHTTA